jgi:hypothetical protein
VAAKRGHREAIYTLMKYNPKVDEFEFEFGLTPFMVSLTCPDFLTVGNDLLLYGSDIVNLKLKIEFVKQVSRFSLEYGNKSKFIGIS